MDEHGLPIVGSGVDYTKVCLRLSGPHACSSMVLVLRPSSGELQYECPGLCHWGVATNCDCLNAASWVIVAGQTCTRVS